MNFLKADFNSKILIQTPIVGQFAQRCPPMGERERSAAPSGVKPLFHRCEEKIQAPN
jgi:hypothetical protein